jgi:hypothetical protein
MISIDEKDSMQTKFNLKTVRHAILVGLRRLGSLLAPSEGRVRPTIGVLRRTDKGERGNLARQ